MISVPDAVLLALVASSLAITAWLSYRSAPAQVSRTVSHSTDVVLDLVQRVERVETAWRNKRTEDEAYIETLEGLASSLERRRAKITSENRRAETREVPDPSAVADSGSRRQDLRRKAGMI